jgi:GT2 family glycosyltransferase
VTGTDATALVGRGAEVPDSPLVSVCILVLSDPTLVLECLDSLARSSRRAETETVVVANGMSVSARRALEGRPDIVLVRSGTNLGFAGGNNLAARIARGRYLFFLNDDSTVTTDCIGRLLATADLDHSIGAIGGRILSADGSLQEAGSVLWNDGSTEHVGAHLPAGMRRFNYLREVDYASANGLLVRRDAWDTVGGFDERYYPAYYEDVDVCLALHQHGFRVVYEPRAVLYHLESQRTTTRYRKFLLARNRRQLVAKWRAELAAQGEPPDAIDDAAIERSIHRARGFPRRLLALVPESSEVSGGALWSAIETLASAGWAVTAVEPAPGVEAEHRPDRTAWADRMIDIGVDVRIDVDGVLDAVTDWDAVLMSSTTRWRRPPIVRSDGSSVPIVKAPAAEGDAGVQAVLAAIAAAVGAAPPPGRPPR